MRRHDAELRVPSRTQRGGMCLLLGATGVGKTLLVKRLQPILPRGAGVTGIGDWGDAGGERGGGSSGAGTLGGVRVALPPQPCSESLTASHS